MPRLRRVSAASLRWRRRRAGRGFTYTTADGSPLGLDDVARVRSLVIPPAWRDVWICEYPNGHLQATGLDAAGRRQYLYHPGWRTTRDTAKFARVAGAAAGLPQARDRVAADLALPGMPLDRAAAVAFRLLDLGAFRIGSDVYADENGSFGLTTLERRHVRRGGDGLVFRFVGKSGISHMITITDQVAVAALDVMRRRRNDSPRLLAHRASGRWADLSSTAVNRYLSELFDEDFTAKDFRTWHATVMAAESLACTEEPGSTPASRKRAVKAAIGSVADYLGNTATVARSSYVDPRVLDLYESGTTIEAAARRSYPSPEKRRAALEAAVLDLLAG